MKKILLYIISLVIILFFCFSDAMAIDILEKDLWLDLYKSIDEWFAELVDLQLEYELSGQWKWSVKETVNSLLSNYWIECNIETVDDIMTIADSENKDQIKTMREKCSKDWVRISWGDATVVLAQMTNIKMTFTYRAREKSQNMYELSKIWLYSDGNDANSPFDLMSDLKEIDAIISNEKIEYDEEWKWYINSGWPCDDYFCVEYEEVMWNYWLKTWTEWLSVDWIAEILKKVLGHIKKAANSPSSTPSKMTVNNFEISAIIPELSKMLRWMWIQVVTMPAPIFKKSSDSEREDESELSPERRLAEYFKNIWMDYYRMNDLNAVRMDIEEKRQIQKSKERSGKTVSEDPIAPYRQATQKNNSYDTKRIDRNTMIDDLQDLYDQFAELHRFASSISAFVNDSCNIIDRMVEIPSS